MRSLTRLVILAGSVNSEGRNLVPDKRPGDAWSYYCTWATQNYEYCANPALVPERNCTTLSWKDLEGGTGNHLADTQCTEQIAFSNPNATCPGCGWFDFHPKAREDLFFLFDAGWGGGRGHDHCGASFMFDPAKFPGVTQGGTSSPEEALAAASKTVRNKGWAGLGTWVGQMNAGSDCESYWTNRSTVSRIAGVLYWKVDGPDRDALVSPIARKVHPRLKVEHATGAGGTQACGLMTMPYSHAQAAVDLIRKTDSYRTYDVSAPHSIPSTLDRLAKYFTALEDSAPVDHPAIMLSCSSLDAQTNWVFDASPQSTIRLLGGAAKFGWASDSGICLTAANSEKGAALTFAKCTTPPSALQLFNFTTASDVSKSHSDCKLGAPTCRNVRLASLDESGAPLCIEFRCPGRHCTREGAWLWQCNAGYQQNMTWEQHSQAYQLELALSEEAGGPFCMGVLKRSNSTEFHGILNGEDEVIMNAVLGCASGVMRNPLNGLRPLPDDYDLFMTAGGRHIKRRMDEVVRAMRWQRLSPPRGLSDNGRVLVSKGTLTDTWAYQHGDTFCSSAIGHTLSETAPAVVTRGLPYLPIVNFVNGSFGQVPFVVASRDPKGRISVATLGRMNKDIGYHHPLAAVVVESGKPVAPVTIGVFGHYASLTMRFDTPIVKHRSRIWAQDLAGNVAVDITDSVSVSADRKELHLDGKMIDIHGRAAASEDDESDPGLVLVIDATSTSLFV